MREERGRSHGMLDMLIGLRLHVDKTEFVTMLLTQEQGFVRFSHSTFHI